MAQFEDPSPEKFARRLAPGSAAASGWVPFRQVCHAWAALQLAMLSAQLWQEPAHKADRAADGAQRAGPHGTEPRATPQGRRCGRPEDPWRPGVRDLGTSVGSVWLLRAEVASTEPMRIPPEGTFFRGYVVFMIVQGVACTVFMAFTINWPEQGVPQNSGLGHSFAAFGRGWLVRVQSRVALSVWPRLETSWIIALPFLLVASRLSWSVAESAAGFGLSYSFDREDGLAKRTRLRAHHAHICSLNSFGVSGVFGKCRCCAAVDATSACEANWSRRVRALPRRAELAARGLRASWPARDCPARKCCGTRNAEK